MGSVYPYTTAGGAKRYRISYRRPDQGQTTERGFTTKRDAEARLAEVEVSKNRGEYVDPASAEVTIATLGKEWLQQREGVLKPSSIRPLQSAWSKHVEPKWGARKIGGIRHSEVQTWVSTIAGGSTTIRRAHGVLAGILDTAVQDRRLIRNVARDVSFPRRSAQRAGTISITRKCKRSPTMRDTPPSSCSSRTRASGGVRRPHSASATLTRSGGA